MFRPSAPIRRKRDLLVVCLALFALLFITTESSLAHQHESGSSAACPVCHIAHHTPIQAKVAVKLPVLTPVSWRVACEIRSPEREIFAADNPSRAPPARS
jgi:hypothetical protein